MNCLQCGAKLEKSDIFCIKCETPVLTDDDIILMPNAETTKFVNEAQYKDPEPYVDEILYTSELKSATAKFSGEIAVENLYIEKAYEPADGAGNVDTKPYNLPPGGKNVKRNNRKAVVMTIVITFVLAAGFGLFLLFSSPGPEQDNTGDAPPVNGSIENNSGIQVLSPDERDVPPPAPAPDITEIQLMFNGRVQTEFHTGVNSAISLQALLIPEGADGEVFWKSSDPDILEVSLNGDGAVIVGVAAGVADIIVSAGDLEFYYIVFVDNLPFHEQLENAVADKDTPVWLTLSWTGTSAAGRETLFERAAGDNVWSLEDTSGRSGILPVFSSEDNVFIIELPDSSRLYYLFADGSGHLSNPDGSDKEDFIWSFMTTLIEPEG